MGLLPTRVAPRLILGTVVLVALGSGITAWLTVTDHERQLVAEKTLAAEQLSRSITSATWHAMRAGLKDDAYEVMTTIGKEQGVEYIRMFGRVGRVAFSSDPASPSTVGFDDVICRVCHVTDTPRTRLTLEERVRTFVGHDGRRKMAILTPVLNEPDCSSAACHAHAPDVHVLGTLDVAMDLHGVDEQIRALKTRSFLLAFLQVVFITAFLVFIVHRLIGVPIRKLILGTRAVGDMQLGRPIDVAARTELGELAASFNTMQGRLEAALADNARFTQDLEQQVEERSKQLEATREQLIQRDRLASLGQLAASVAHEVNNPLSAVLNLSMLLQRMLTEDGIPADRLADFHRHLGQIVDETGRAGRIVTDLLAFSRRSTPQRAPADLNDIVDRTVALVGHQADLAGVAIEVRRDVPRLLVSCERSQIEQVLLNLLLNALEALPDGGRIVAETREDGDAGLILVTDDGPGIAPQHLPRIFDPFFTTKEGEKGVGLGLSVAYGIVDAHGGRLRVESTPSEGTTFEVRLPRDPGTGEESTS